MSRNSLCMQGYDTAINFKYTKLKKDMAQVEFPNDF